MDNRTEANHKIEAMDKAIRDGSMTIAELTAEIEAIANLLGEDANRVFVGPPVVSGDVFRRGKVEHR